MKKIIFLAFACVLASRGNAQPVSYTIDSTSFNSVTLEGGLTEVECADINRDGHLDFLTIGDHGSPNVNSSEHGITVFFGNGTGAGWTLFQNGNFGYGGIAVGDINNDGIPDVAYSMHHNYSLTDFGNQIIEAALGDGTGMNWTPWDDSLGTNGETWGMFGIDLGDVDNDGLLDIGSNSFGCCAGTHIYLNGGNGTWRQSYGFLNGNTRHYIQFGDMNHDGNLDFVTSHEYGSPYFGNGNGNFSIHQSGLPVPGGVGYWDFSLADIDNDGDDDFAFATPFPFVFKWNNASMQWQNSSTGLPSNGNYYCLRLCDLNMDGFADLVGIKAGLLTIWQGNGGTSWSVLQSIPVPNLQTAADLSFGDVDHNGYPDILLWANYQITLFTDINRIKLFRENHVPSVLDISLLYPKNYECFPNNAVRFIRWITAVPNHDATSVRIELSTAGTSGPWTLLDAAAPNNDKYQWTVPASVSSSDCYFRLVVTDSATTSTDTVMNANPFQIGVCNPTLNASEITRMDESSAAPNPFSYSTTLYSSLKDCSVSIYDVTGKLVQLLSKVKQFPFTLHRGNLEDGIYLLEIRSQNGNVARQKLAIH